MTSPQRRSSVPEVWFEALRCDGFCVIDAESRVELKQIIGTLGPVLRRTRVALRKAAGTHLTSPGPIAPHTDDPSARWIAWICHVQDEIDGACLLVDGHAALRNLDDD